MAVVSALLAGYAGASYAATGAASGAAGPTDTEPPPTATTPAPAPDPAPPPAPKPAPKPAPRPATVYHAPVTPTPTHTYTPPTPTRVAPHATPKVAHRKPKRHKTRAKHITPAPKPKPKPKAQVEGASVVKIAGVSATVETNQPNTARRAFVISGIGLAALLFLLVVSIPATAMRFTAAGRVVMDHQTDLVLAGIGTLLLTALLFAITGIGS